MPEACNRSCLQVFNAHVYTMPRGLPASNLDCQQRSGLRTTLQHGRLRSGQSGRPVLHGV